MAAGDSLGGSENSFKEGAAHSPRIALVRDEALYDVEKLEEMWADAREAHARFDLREPSDFHTRVATLRCAGLYDLDARLIRGERPSAARIPAEQAMLLAPCDTDRAMLVEVDLPSVRAGARPCARIGQARALLGQDAVVGVSVPHEHTNVELELGIAVVLGDDLSSGTAAEARRAIMGYAIFVDWIVPKLDLRPASLGAVPAISHPSSRWAPIRGIAPALGPTLVSPYVVPKIKDAQGSIRHRGASTELTPISDFGVTIEDALAAASAELDLRTGDVVAFGPLLHGRSQETLFRIGLHDPVEITIEGLGSLRSTAVPKRTRPLERR
jgi:2-keto-4-pentenoate hydratase/2-oxohepta-3-ene-1,7-dioic acid hydratase in catechol pathway